MRRTHSLLGLIGLILLFFGLVSYLLTGVVEPYAVIHLAAGVVLLGYFLAASFRELGDLLSARSTRYGANMVVYSVLFLALLAGINWLGVRYDRRFDMSEAGVFSLSPQARSVVENLPGEVRLQAFLEGGHDAQIEDLLESFAAASEEIRVELIDPDAQPELAQKYGIRSYGTVRVALGEQSTTVSQPSEESITNALIKVGHAEQHVVAVLQGEGEPDLKDLQSAQGFGELQKELENENYVVRPLFLLQEPGVPDDVDVVVVTAGEKPLLRHEVDALREFLARGGRAVFLVPPETGRELEPLLADYGVKIGQDVVVDEVLRLFQGPQLGLNPLVETYGVHPITEHFRNRTIFPLVRSVAPGETREGLTVTSIAKTSRTSWAETDLDTLFGRGQASLDEKTDRPGPISVAVAATADLSALGRGEGEARLVVFGSAKLANNKYIGMLFNRDLFLNAVGWLVGQEDLVSIRPRSVRASRVQFTEQQATAIFYLSVLALPEVLAMIGLAVWWRRSSL